MQICYGPRTLNTLSQHLDYPDYRVSIYDFSNKFVSWSLFWVALFFCWTKVSSLGNLVAKSATSQKGIEYKSSLSVQPWWLGGLGHQLSHSVDRGTKHFPLFSQRPFHIWVYLIVLCLPFLVLTQTQYCVSNTQILPSCDIFLKRQYSLQMY